MIALDFQNLIHIYNQNQNFIWCTYGVIFVNIYQFFHEKSCTQSHIFNNFTIFELVTLTFDL